MGAPPRGRGPPACHYFWKSLESYQQPLAGEGRPRPCRPTGTPVLSRGHRRAPAALPPSLRVGRAASRPRPGYAPQRRPPAGRGTRPERPRVAPRAGVSNGLRRRRECGALLPAGGPGERLLPREQEEAARLGCLSVEEDTARPVLGGSQHRLLAGEHHGRRGEGRAEEKGSWVLSWLRCPGRLAIAAV